MAKAQVVMDVSTSAWEAEKAWRERQGEKFERGRSALLVNAMLVAAMIASAIYAPVAQYSWLPWGLCSGCAALLSRRGVNWQSAWREASRNLTGW